MLAQSPVTAPPGAIPRRGTAAPTTRHSGVAVRGAHDTHKTSGDRHGKTKGQQQEEDEANSALHATYCTRSAIG